MKRTKILATLGPVSSSPEKIKQLIDVGANAFRINMSHGTQDSWEEIINNIRKVSGDIPIVMDTQGPEHRILGITGQIKLNPGDNFTFSQKPNKDMPYSSHIVNGTPGHKILFDDGAISSTILERNEDIVTVKIETEGTLTDRRKITTPEALSELPVIGEVDKHDLEFCKRMLVDAIALSFTQTADDVKLCRELVGDHVVIIAKIENQTGVENVDQILKAADSIMVARGDLGVEIPLEEVPVVQKKIIRQANNVGKPVIVATQMLESMTFSPVPTRAEVSDVANAIMDGADCVMLSGETAKGKYPVETVRTMARIATRTDSTMRTTVQRSGKLTSISEAISNAVYDISNDLKADAIITATGTGFTARMVARFRPHLPLIAIAHDERVKRQLQLSWGVTPIVFRAGEFESYDTVYEAVQTALSAQLIQPDHTVIVTAGVNTKKAGSTNLIEVHIVKDLIASKKQR
jgi:pyruvate kinase